MRMPCGGRLRRAREGIEWLRAIGVSTVPLGQKAVENCHRYADKQLKAPEKTENPPPVSDFVRHPYILMNLGQRDEPLRLHYATRSVHGMSSDIHR